MVQGVILLLPHFEQTVYKAALTLDGIEIPIIKKQIDGDTGGVAVGNFVVQGVILLLPHFEQTVYKAALTLDGIEIPIIKKQIAPPFLPGIV